MMEHRVVSDNGLRQTEDGVAIDVRIPWYRTLPLSVIAVGDVLIDDEQIDRRRMSFEIEGRTYSLEDLRYHDDVDWFVLDSGFVHVAGLKLEPGSSHKVSVTISARPPYANDLNRVVETTKTLVVA